MISGDEFINSSFFFAKEGEVFNQVKKAVFLTSSLDYGISSRSRLGSISLEISETTELR